jgi:hypothetical protein
VPSTKNGNTLGARQTITNNQITKNQNFLVWNFGIWNLEFVWDLGFRIWDLGMAIN